MSTMYHMVFLGPLFTFFKKFEKSACAKDRSTYFKSPTVLAVIGSRSSSQAQDTGFSFQ